MSSASQSIEYEEINFNGDWEFVKNLDSATVFSNMAANGEAIRWQKVSLPHTARIEPIEKTEQQWQGTAFYKKSFFIPASVKDKHIALKFEAAMQVADVYLNGQHVFKHKGGYLPFYVDIAKYIKTGEQNTVLVRLNNEDNPKVAPGKPLADLDFNYYSGLYRNAYLVIKDRLHISDPIAANKVAGGGILIHFDTVSNSFASALVQTDLQNDYAIDKTAQLKLTLLDIEGKTQAEAISEAQTVQVGNSIAFRQRLNLDNPKLWSTDKPYLYTLRAEVLENNKVIDSQELKVGIRRIEFKTGGFYLNGEKMFLRGTNRHQEYPWVGYALSDNANFRDAYKIKEAGFNFVRLSHYPQSPAFMQACDELGLLVMDAIPGWQFFGDDEFQQNALQDVRDMVRRDRNHPSVILWEASLNESEMSRAFMEKSHRAVHEELPFKNVYTCGWLDEVFDVFIPARQHGKAPNYWNEYIKQKPIFIAEYGDWEYYAQNAGFNQKEFADLKEEERTSRQLRGFGQKRLLQQALNYQEAHNSNLQGPAVGDANWLMFDYKRGYAPDIEASGVMDIMRLPKFAYYFYKSQQDINLGTDSPFGKPVLFIANYWNDPDLKSVRVFSNADEVALYLNDRLIARQKPDTDKYSTHLRHPPFTFNLPTFSPGKLKAIAYLKGKQIAETTSLTPEKPVKLALKFDESGKPATAGVKDIMFVYAEVMDSNGTVVPNATPSVTFEVEGDAKIVADNRVVAEAGVATVLIEIGKSTGPIIIKAQAPGLQEASTTINAIKAK